MTPGFVAAILEGFEGTLDAVLERSRTARCGATSNRSRSTLPVTVERWRNGRLWSRPLRTEGVPSVTSAAPRRFARIAASSTNERAGAHRPNSSRKERKLKSI